MSAATIAAVVASYFLGSVPVGFTLVKAMRGVDIRTTGSGNIGATNVARVMGIKWFFVVFFLDLLKGLAPCVVVGRLSGHTWLAQPANLAVVLAGLAAVVGHTFPVFLGFRGGKGVATSAGVCVYALPTGVLAAVIVWIVAAAIWRYVSLASLMSVAAAWVTEFLLNVNRLAAAKYAVAFATVVSAIIVWRHKANIRRLLDGTENKISRKQKQATPGETNGR